jgi:thymidylate synthase
MEKFSIIAAFLKKSRGIGFENKLPWKHNKEDMAHFTRITTGGFTMTSEKLNAVIMGKKTWQSMAQSLKNRINIVITRDAHMKNNNDTPIIFTRSFDEALQVTQIANKNVNKRFLIGGEYFYAHTITNPNCEKLYLTEIDDNVDGKVIPVDKYFPSIPSWFRETSRQNNKSNTLSFVEYDNMLDPLSAECSYLQCLYDILLRGEIIKDRTGVGTRSLFSQNLNFDIHVLNPEEDDQTKIKYTIPALTTKKMFFNGVIWELIWFLNGFTDATWLQKRKVHIWDGNTTREYLDKIGLTNVKTGEIGLGYGYQWINWNGQNINQIENIINTLKTNPASRRIVLSAWNVGQLDKMALPPCHMMYIFKVSNHHLKKKTLNCQVILRSNDMFLGSPFNILSTAFLTILISRCVNMHPGSISLNITDAHIYENHIDQVKEQLVRIPCKFPTLEIDKCIGSYEDMCNLINTDFLIKDYTSWAPIKANMAV